MFVPSQELLSDIQLPSKEGIKTQGDLIRWTLKTEEEVDNANVRFEVLREYRKMLLRKRDEFLEAK